MLTKLTANRKGMDALLKSPEVLRDLEERAVAIGRQAEATGSGEFAAEGTIGRTRARASVRTADHEARRSEALDRTLTNAIDAGRS